MAHRVSPRVEADLDDIWLYIAGESGSMDVATRLIDSISDRLHFLAVLGQARRRSKMFRVGLYARVSTNDQQTIPLQIRALREYAARPCKQINRQRRTGDAERLSGDIRRAIFKFDMIRWTESIPCESLQLT